jgi:hypothetical protein
MKGYYLTSEQFNVLDKLDHELNIPELYSLLADIEKQETDIMQQAECPEHRCIIEINDNSDDRQIMISGKLAGYGGEIEWCGIVTESVWLDTVEKAMQVDSTYDFSNEEFGGRTSDTMFKAIDFVGHCDICYCPEKILAYRVLGKIFGENPIEILNSITPEMKDTKYHVPIEEYIVSRNVNNRQVLDSSLPYTNYVPSFLDFLKRYKDISHEKTNPDLHYLCRLANCED